MNQEYISTIIRKTNRLARAYAILPKNPPRMIREGAISLLEKSEQELSKFDRNLDLEKTLAREIISIELQGAQGGILEKDSCSSCKVLQVEIEKQDQGLLFEEYPMCAQKRIMTPTRHCPEYQQIHNLQSDFREMDREKFMNLNELLKLIDNGFLDNYKEILKIK